MSTPTSLELPDGVRRTTIRTARGAFAALEAVPASRGVRAGRRPARPRLHRQQGRLPRHLGPAGRRQPPGGRDRHARPVRDGGAGEPGGYAAAALGADILAIMHATGARHLVGHSYGGLIGREAVLAAAGAEFASFTLMSSGPGALTGPRAKDLRAMLAALGVACRRQRRRRRGAGRTRPRSGPGSPSSGGRTWSRRPSRPASPATSSRSWAAGCWATTRTGWS